MLKKLKKQIPSKVTRKYWNVNVETCFLLFGIMSMKSMVLSSPQGVIWHCHGLSLQQIYKASSLGSRKNPELIDFNLQAHL
jgi:hypothetical protein